MSSADIRRGFAEILEGQIHYREAGWKHGGLSTQHSPLVMLHPSPGSAKMLEPLIGALGRKRHVVAPDTLGNGDSSQPKKDDPDISYFADAHLRGLDALGIEQFDLYGSHTGANIACEIAIAHPDRVKNLILDGISLYSADERADMLVNYAREITLDLQGTQLNRVWHFVRDVYLFWPWYRPHAANRRHLGLPSADDLHDKVVEVLKSVRTYHIPYRAAIAYDKADRLPLIPTRTLLACASTDMFMSYFDDVKKLMPFAQPLITPGTSTPENLQSTISSFETFLDA